MVTVVDAGVFLEVYTTGDRLIQRPDLGVSGERQREKQKFSRARASRVCARRCVVVCILSLQIVVLSRSDDVRFDGLRGINSL